MTDAAKGIIGSCQGRPVDAGGSVYAELVQAAAAGEREAVAAAAARLGPVISAIVARVCRQSPSDQGDVQQEVTLRLCTSPPVNPNARDPELVVRAWIGVVARRIFVDGKRKTARLRAMPQGQDGELEPADSARGADEALGWARAGSALHDAAQALRRRKHLYQAFEILLGDADTPGIELAEKLGLVPPAPPEPWPAAYLKARAKAEQLAYQVRRRMLTELAKALEARQ